MAEEKSTRTIINHGIYIENYCPTPTGYSSKEVADTLQPQGEPTAAGSDLTVPAPATMNGDLVVADAIQQVMELRDEEGEYLFTNGVHWQGIYRVLADHHMVQARDYAGFGGYIASLALEGLRVPLDAKGLSKTDSGVFAKPLREWNAMHYAGKRSTFDRYMRVALAFDDLLTQQHL